MQRISLLCLSFFVCVSMYASEPHYSRWSLSSFIAYVTKPRCDQNSRRHYMYAGGTVLGFGALLSWVAWKLRPKKNLEANKVIEPKKNESETNKSNNNVEEPFDPACALIVNHLSIVSGIQGNEHCKNKTKKNEDLDQIEFQFYKLMETHNYDYAQKSMIQVVRGYFQDQEVNKAIFDVLHQSKKNNQKVTTTVNKQEALSNAINQVYDIKIEAQGGEIINIRKGNLKINGEESHFSQCLYPLDTFIVLINSVCKELDHKAIIALTNHYNVWINAKQDRRFVEDSIFDQRMMRYGIHDDTAFKYRKVKDLLHKLPIPSISGRIKESLHNTNVDFKCYRERVTEEDGSYFGWNSAVQNGEIINLSLNKFTPKKDIPGGVQTYLVEACDAQELRLFNQVMQELK